MTINENIDDKALEAALERWHESAKLFAVQIAQALGVKLNQLQFEMVIATLEVSFAAGLAKGEAHGARLREALKPFADAADFIDNAPLYTRVTQDFVHFTTPEGKEFGLSHKECEAARAALAAVDEGRAEEFDADVIARKWSLGWYGTDEKQAVHRVFAPKLADELRLAFAAGLAKGAVERAALVEALEAALPTVEKRAVSAPDAGARMAVSKIHRALALVRKGV